jgi:hypothetical protein
MFSSFIRGRLTQLALLPLTFHSALSQTFVPPVPAQAGTTNGETIVLNPFVVDATTDKGYQATSTLAGSRLRTDLKDIGASISVITAEMLEDLGAVDNRGVLAHVTNAEIAGGMGNYSGGVIVGGTNGVAENTLFENPNANTRIRGLSAADSTLNFFLSDVSWDGYNTSRIDLQRGPNAILAGLGSPAGLINATYDRALFRDRGTLQARVDMFGSVRGSLNLNRVLLKDELAARFALLRDDKEFRQDPAFEYSKRAYLAATYKPRFLNRGPTRFELSGSFEYGDIKSNRPRNSTPQDQITPFWTSLADGGLGKTTYNHITPSPLSPRLSPALGSPLLSLNPVWTVNSAGAVVGARAGVNTSSPWSILNLPTNYGIRNAAGELQGSIRADGTVVASAVNLDGQNRPLVSIDSANNIAIRRLLPYADIYDPAGLSDPSVFDFYNKLIDGPNKSERRNWKVLNLEVSNTFFRDKLGYNIAYFRQELDESRFTAMALSNRIFIDINQINPDGSPNPNIGRAYAFEQLGGGGSRSGLTDRDAARVQVFAEHNFREGDKGFWGRLLGKHRVTGLAAHEGKQAKSYVQKLYAVDPAFNAIWNNQPAVSNGLTPTFRYYLSGDLRGLNSPSGANLSNVADPVLHLPSTVPVTYFDMTWLGNPATGTTATSGFGNAFTQVVGTGSNVQASNPANYRGWVTRDVKLYSLFNPDEIVAGTNMKAKDYLATRVGATTVEDRFNTKVLVWQGYLWSDSIVGLYGWREDRARNYAYFQDQFIADTNRNDGGANLDPSVFNYDNPNGRVTYAKGQTRNWSVAMHTNRLLGRRDFLPLNVSVYYNQGENFKPTPGRRDAVGVNIPDPVGSTKEWSVLLATKDDRFSIRATRYETRTERQAMTSSLGASFFGFQQMWASTGPNDYYVQIQRYLNNLPGVQLNPANHPEYGDRGSVAPGKIYTIVGAWGNFARQLTQKFPGFVNTWGLPTTISNIAPAGTSFVLTGINLTEDATSKGYEIEFTANPTRNWRMALNASQTEATRRNIPGTNTADIFNWIDDQMMNTDAGLMPMFSFNGVNGLRGSNYGVFHRAWVKEKALNGQSATEIRKWRFNGMTNYTLSQGFLRGVGLGGAIRWEDRAVMDYEGMTVAGASTFDLTKPLYTPATSAVDLWISYGRKVTESVNWKVQLNVNNAFGKNELIPINAQPDGTPSAFRIKEGVSWSLTNTFTF